MTATTTTQQLAPTVDPNDRRVFHVPALRYPLGSDGKDVYEGQEEHANRSDVGDVGHLDDLPERDRISYVASSFLTMQHSNGTVVDGPHAPVFDLDIPARLVPSATEGHTHLYLDVSLSWDEYAEVLEVLGKVGILEAGYVRASIARQGTFVRAYPATKMDRPANPAAVSA